MKKVIQECLLVERGGRGAEELLVFRSKRILTEGSAVGEFSPSPPPPTQDEEFSNTKPASPWPRHSFLYCVTKVTVGKMAR